MSQYLITTRATVVRYYRVNAASAEEAVAEFECGNLEERDQTTEEENVVEIFTESRDGMLTSVPVPVAA